MQNSPIVPTTDQLSASRLCVVGADVHGGTARSFARRSRAAPGRLRGGTLEHIVRWLPEVDNDVFNVMTKIACEGSESNYYAVLSHSVRRMREMSV